MRQSIPSVSIESCAGVRDTTPSVFVGHTKSAAFQALGDELPPISLDTDLSDRRQIW